MTNIGHTGRVRAVLVRSELESLHAPEEDLWWILRSLAWEVTELNHRNFAVQELGKCDLVIVAQNALDQTSGLREQLEKIANNTNVLIFHQNSADSLVTIAPCFARSHNGRGNQATITNDRDSAARRQIMSWPENIALDIGLPLIVRSSLDDSIEELESLIVGHCDDGSHRILCGVDRSAPKRLIYCGIAFQVGRDAEASIARNLLQFAARGAPPLVLVHDDESAGPMLALEGLLWLAGATPSVVSCDELTLDMAQAPMAQASEVVIVTGERLAIQSRDCWEKTGLALMSAEGPSVSSVNVSLGHASSRSLDQRFAEFIDALPGAVWHGGLDDQQQYHRGSLFSSHAVLSSMAVLSCDRKITFTPPAGMASALLELAEARRAGDSNVEATVSTTLVLLELDEFLRELVPGAELLPPQERTRVDDWLKSQIPVALAGEILAIKAYLGIPIDPNSDPELRQASIVDVFSWHFRTRAPLANGFSCYFPSGPDLLGAARFVELSCLVMGLSSHEDLSSLRIDWGGAIGTISQFGYWGADESQLSAVFRNPIQFTREIEAICAEFRARRALQSLAGGLVDIVPILVHQEFPESSGTSFMHRRLLEVRSSREELTEQVREQAKEARGQVRRLALATQILSIEAVAISLVVWFAAWRWSEPTLPNFVGLSTLVPLIALVLLSVLDGLGLSPNWFHAPSSAISRAVKQFWGFSRRFRRS